MSITTTIQRRHKIVAGALALSLGLGLAGAAQAQEDGTAGFRATVERGISKQLNRHNGQTDSRKGIATVAIFIDGEGKVLATGIAHSTGWADLDREALRTAQTVSYPATGKPRSVAMVLGFNRQVTADMHKAARQEVLAWQRDQRLMLANTYDAQQPDS